MIENSALRLGGGLWNAIAGHDEPFGLTSVCAARPNFFPPMPAQYPSFKIGGLMGVACWQQYDTISVSPSGNFEPNFSHLASNSVSFHLYLCMPNCCRQMKVRGPDSRASLCSSSTTLWNRAEKQARISPTARISPSR